MEQQIDRERNFNFISPRPSRVLQELPLQVPLAILQADPRMPVVLGPLHLHKPSDLPCLFHLCQKIKELLSSIAGNRTRSEQLAKVGLQSLGDWSPRQVLRPWLRGHGTCMFMCRSSKNRLGATVPTLPNLPTLSDHNGIKLRKGLDCRFRRKVEG